MRYILWAQNETPDIKPTILVDDTIINGDDSQLYFSKLNQVNQNLALSPEIREKLYSRYKDKGLSLQTNYCILDNNQGVYIQSCYVERDEADRKMPFMFYYGNGSNLEDAISVLKAASRKLGRSCNEYDFQIIRGNEAILKKKEIVKFVTFFVISIIVILCVIFKPEALTIHVVSPEKAVNYKWEKNKAVIQENQSTIKKNLITLLSVIY